MQYVNSSIPSVPHINTPQHIDMEDAQVRNHQTEGLAYPSITELVNALQQAPEGAIIVLTMNMRSCQDLFKVHHLTHCLRGLPASADVVITIQETWLRSEDARQRLRTLLLGEGWTATTLERALPSEPHSGGLLTLIKEGQRADEDQLHVQHAIVDSLGITSTTMYRTHATTYKRKIEHTTAILNAYVPTGQNKLDRCREEQMTERFLGAVVHASQHNAKIIVTGDWNHLTNVWQHHLSTMGFEVTSQYDVEIIMAKDRDGRAEGGMTHEPTHHAHPLYTDHPLLFAYLEPQMLEEELLHDISPNRALLAEHEKEYKRELQNILDTCPPAGNAGPTERMRWAAEQMKQVGQLLTRKYRKQPGKKYMFYPRRIQKLHDKLRGHRPMAVGETKEQIIKRVTRAMAVWLQRRLDTLQRKRDTQYDTNMKRTFQLLNRTPNGNPRILDEECTRQSHTTAEARDECARRVIGTQWQKPAPHSLTTDVALEGEWTPYVTADPRDSLRDIGAPVTEQEILAAYAHMGNGKATQHDGVSKEMMDLVPTVYRDIFVAYIKQAFDTCTTEVEEGQTDIVLLTKKQNKNLNEITNKRPIALMKFVTKWLHAILAHRIQQRVQHLANYGFQKEKSTASAVRKITALIEYAQLHKLAIHLMTVDLEKAYDSVPFELIERALLAHHCPPRIVRLILKTHTQRALHFKIDGHIGQALTPERGVAQGSPLSCIMFVMCMQPLLLRLQDQTLGLWGPEDDVAYVDDITLIAGTAGQLKHKWDIVKSFERWTQMKVNIVKCEYDTTEINPAKWAHLPGVTNLRQSQTPDDALRILGYWAKVTGEREEHLKKIITSIRLVSMGMRKKLMSPAIAKGIINQIMSSRLNYTAQIHEIPTTHKRVIKAEVNKLARAQFGIAGPSITHRLYTPPDQGGLVLDDPDNVADRAMVTEYLIALNSNKEQYTAKLLRENAAAVQHTLPIHKPPPRKTRATSHTPWCRTCMSYGHGCSCQPVIHQDTMHAQALRCAHRLGWRLQETELHERSIDFILKEKQRQHHNGKNRLEQGELIWMRHINTGDERLAAFHGHNPHNRGRDSIALTWLPAIRSKHPRAHGTILGRSHDAEKRQIPLDKAYIEQSKAKNSSGSTLTDTKANARYSPVSPNNGHQTARSRT